MPTIHLDDDIGRWRWTCLACHRSWEPTNHYFWCHQCARNTDPQDPEFHQLRNAATDDLYERDAITLETEAGTYSDVTATSL